MTVHPLRSLGLVVAFALFIFYGFRWFSTQTKTPRESAPIHFSAATMADSPPLARVTKVTPEPSHDTLDTVVPHEGGTVSGRVVDEHNRPLATVAVTVYALGVLHALQQTRTTEDGTFELLGLPVAQTLELDAELVGYRSTRVEVLLAHPGSTLERTLTLRTGQTLAGRVFSSEGSPVKGALIASTDDASPTVHSDENGAFSLFGLRNEPVNIYVQSPGFATRQLRHIAPGQTQLKVVLERPATVQGNIQIPSTVLELLVSACHFDVDFKKELCVTRQLLHHSDTRYRLEGLSSGPYDLVMSAAGYPEKRHAFVAVAGQELSGPALALTQ